MSTVSVWSPPQLERGQQTAQAVLDIIRQYPDSHDQDAWEIQKGCGTSRCVAGWAQYLHEGQVDSQVRHLAAIYLDLNNIDSWRLFMKCDNREAVHALEYVAKGDLIDWDAVFAERRALEAMLEAAL